MPTITRKLIAESRPREKPYDLRDDQIRGFVLRVLPSGGKRYYAQYGRGKRYLIGDAELVTLTRARTRARSLLGEAADGVDLMREKRKQQAATFADYLERVYGPWVKTNRKDGAATLARLISVFGDDLAALALNEIKPKVVEDWRTRRREAGRAPATINRDLSALRAALSMAVEWELLSSHPLGRKVKSEKGADEHRVRYLTAEETRRLRAALDDRELRARRERRSGNAWRKARGYPLLPDLEAVAFVDHIKPLTLLALNTGCRRGELFQITWRDVDFGAQTLTVRAATTKGQRTRRVPLNGEALQVLRAWKKTRKARDGLVFPGQGGARLTNLKKAWSALMKNAQIADFRFHDCRHDFASKLVMAGVDLYTVQKLLGHSSITMTERYAHLAPAHLREAVNRLGGAA